jgi:hypothetical protein
MPESMGIALSRIADQAPFFCTKVSCSTFFGTDFESPTEHLLEGHTLTGIIQTITNSFSSNDGPIEVIAISCPIALPREQYEVLHQAYKYTHDHCMAFLKGCRFNVKGMIDIAECLFLDLTPGQVAAKLVRGKINYGRWQLEDERTVALTVLGTVDELSTDDVVNKLVLPTVSSLDAIRCIGILQPENSFPNISSWDLRFHFPDIPLLWLSVADLSHGSACVAEYHTPLIEMCDYDGGPDITATSLCIELADGQLVTLLPIGSTLPMSRLFYLTTSKDNQTTATLQFCKDDVPCNRTTVEGLTPRSRGTTRVKVLARCDRFRETTVIIQELGSWEKTMVTLERTRTMISDPVNPVRSFQWSESPSFGVDGIIGELPE